MILEWKSNNAPSLSLWKPFRNTSNLSLLRRKIASICTGFFGLATKTYGDHHDMDEYTHRIGEELPTLNT